ncbi:MAG: hypothetical protein ABIJ20_01105 [Nanoarchaeota archaeon]|nr:hypothetical protein [Nanoarchaeota archaeon]MBU1445237.1 hypothetical protein [Nanoarchaeota archaeon]MBU2420391.1 hypothetical protein [Nanoarchaeota archaeon]MBU2475169.1 hypothetical protein [Nanoarchaeota archaeon]
MKYILIIILIGLIFISGCTIDCGKDLDCFKEQVQNYNKARVNIINEGTNIRITCRGVSKDICLISFKIEEVSEDLRQEDPISAKIVVGKTLNCNIPLEVLEQDEDYFDKILSFEEEFDQYCTGPIKDILIKTIET